MAGEINISVLLRFMADQARREIAGTSGDLKTLGTAAAEAGQRSATAGAAIDSTGVSLARSTSETINATAAMGRAAVATADMRDMATGLSAANLDATQATASMSTAIGAAQTAMRSAQAAGAGYTVSIGDQVDAMLRHQQASQAWQAELDGIRAKFNPLFAASKQYEATLREISEAEKMGALNAAEAAAARDRAAQSIRPMPALLNQYGVSTNMATGATANLFAQWNDIGIMMAAGQNPLQLAMQQGTQVSQVLMQLGGGKAALRAIGTSFMAMLNPISLATIGIIAFGAAGVQWLASLGEETRTFDDDLKYLNTTLDRMRTNLG
ncbi:MAG: phage tail length tape measure family protein, partial [Pseudodonghicola sp.]